MSKAEDYLKNNVKQILQPMVKDIMTDRPKDPVNKYPQYFIYFYSYRFYL